MRCRVRVRVRVREVLTEAVVLLLHGLQLPGRGEELLPGLRQTLLHVEVLLVCSTGGEPGHSSAGLQHRRRTWSTAHEEDLFYSP